MSRLTLKEKVNVIKGLDCGKTQSALSKEFNVSRKTVQNILKRKAELMSSYNENEPADRKRRATCKFSEIDASVWEWFKKMRSQNKPIDGPTIQAKALEFARELRIQEDSFKASNGWLSSWRARHNVTYGSITGEGAAVDLTAVADWKMKIPELTNGYEQKDIYNLDETGLVFRRTPSKTMKIKGEDCKGGKKAKERLTVCLLVNMLGKFETPLVIGKSAHPRAFKHVKSLPVVWRCNKSAWMTSNLFEEMIARFNEKMRREGRHVLLFLDNAPCHPKLTFSNVKLVFFPANMTTHAQPLDQMTSQLSQKISTFWMPATGSVLQFWTSKRRLSGNASQLVAFQRRTVTTFFQMTMITLIWLRFFSGGRSTMLKSHALFRILSRLTTKCPLLAQTVKLILFIRTTMRI